MAQHNELGRWGEDIAAQYLRQKGWYIRHRNWRCEHEELDIVAIDELSTTLLVVEVKTRSDSSFGAPEEAVDLVKMHHLINAASAYVADFHLPWIDVRYDIISIVGTPQTPPVITHKEGAFDVSMQHEYRELLRSRYGRRVRY